MRPGRTNFQHTHEIINAWEAAISGDHSRIFELGYSLKQSELIDAAKDVMISAATFGLESVEQIVTRLHRVSAHLEDARLVDDDTWLNPGFSPAQIAILDLADALGSCGAPEGKTIQIRVVTEAKGTALAGAVISAIAVTTNEAGLGVSTPDERVGILRGFYDVKQWAVENKLI